MGVGERTGEALGEVWLARGALPLDFPSREGGFLPLGGEALGGEALRLWSGLFPAAPFIITGGGVLGLGGRL